MELRDSLSSWNTQRMEYLGVCEADEIQVVDGSCFKWSSAFGEAIIVENADKFRCAVTEIRPF